MTNEYRRGSEKLPLPEAKPAHERRYLSRLESLVDSVYALVLVLLVADLPTAVNFPGDYDSPWQFLSEHWGAIGLLIPGLVLIVSYWLQHNALFGNLSHTDNRHAVLSIVQIIVLLIYFWSVAMQADFPDSQGILAIQSLLMATMGFIAIAAWRYACKDRRLLDDAISDESIKKLDVVLLPEPITALITVVAAGYSTEAWGLSWLSYPVVAWLVKRRQKS